MKPVLLIASCAVCVLVARSAETNTLDIQKMIVAVAKADGELKGIPFADVVMATTGKRVLAFEQKNEADRELLLKIGSASNEDGAGFFDIGRVVKDRAPVEHRSRVEASEKSIRCNGLRRIVGVTVRIRFM